MNLLYRFINGIKNKSLDLYLFLFFVGCFVLLKIKDPVRVYLSYALFIGLLVMLYLKRQRAREIIIHFIRFESGGVVNKLAGWASLLAWGAFLLFPFAINIRFGFLAKVLLVMFSIFIVISSVLTIFVLEKDGHEKVKNIRVMLFSFISICYVLSSAFSASLFLQLSNMDLSSSPWLEFTWKLSSFFVLIFFILQLTTYVIFIVTADHAKGYRLFTIFGALILTSLIVLFVSSRPDVVAYYVLKYSTGSEWRSDFTCENEKISRPNERYFGYNTDKYTAYFFNRNGKWGFDEITCVKNSQEGKGYTVKNVSTENIPHWVK
ncbi:hypothetical protein ACQ8AK_000827 [Enterobacter hormaechei]